MSKGVLAASGIFLIRSMPEVEYAYYTLALSIASIFIQIFASSLNRIYIIGAKNLSLTTSSSSFLCSQIICLAGFATLSLPLIEYLDLNHSNIYIGVLLLSLSTCLLEFVKTFFQKNLNFFYFSLIDLCKSVFILFAILAFVYFLPYQLNTSKVLMINSVGCLSVTTIFGINRLKRENLSYCLNIKHGFHLLSQIINSQYKYLLAYFICLTFFSNLDVFMLKALSNTVELSSYGSAFQYYTFLLLGLNAVKSVLLPVIQKAENSLQLKKIFKIHLIMLGLFTLIAIILSILSTWIIPLLDLGKYPSSIPVFQVLAISAIISFAFSPYVDLIMRFEDFRLLFFLINVGLLLNLGFNMIAIPVLGAIGAAIATVISFGVVNIFCFIRAKKHMNIFIS